MTVYLDIILLENICMNYIILLATGIINKCKISHFRIMISSLLGAIYAIITYLNIFEAYSNLIFKMILSIVMIYIAYLAKNVKKLFKELIIFYLTSFAFGGISFALLYMINPSQVKVKNGVFVGTYPLKVVLLGGIVGFLTIIIAFKSYKGRMNKKDIYYDIKIKLGDKEVETKAIIDTGNFLKEPITGFPVVVVERSLMYSIIPKCILNNIDEILSGNLDKMSEHEEYISRIRVIPYSSLGNKNGMLLGIKADQIIIENKIVNNIILGIYKESLTKMGEYRALVGLELVQ